MDLPLTIVFWICAAMAVVGALTSALVATSAPRLVGLVGVAAGTAGALAVLSAGFVGLVALVCLGASALLLALPAPSATGRGGRPQPAAPAAARRQGRWPSALGLDPSAWVGGGAAALLLLAVGFVALRGGFAAGDGAPGAFGAATVGRLLFGRDAVALEAVGALLMVALAVAAGAWSRRS